jgi:hypothetical protein
MTTGNHTHDRPMVNWCAFWQVMAARSAETRPWWAVMAAKSENGSAVLISATGLGSPGPARRAITRSRPMMAAKHTQRRYQMTQEQLDQMFNHIYPQLAASRAAMQLPTRLTF